MYLNQFRGGLPPILGVGPLQIGYTASSQSPSILRLANCLRQMSFQSRIRRKPATPDRPVKTNRKVQNYRSEILTKGMWSKVKPLFRYLNGTSKIFPVCQLRRLTAARKMGDKVARKLFATIRYRFSHLDNGLISEAAGRPNGAFRGVK